MKPRSLLLFLPFLLCCGGEPGPGSTPDTSFTMGRPPLPQPPAESVGGFGIELPAFKLAPGQERQPCYIFPLDVEGPSRVVAAGSVTTGPGLHHGNITTRPKTGEGIRTCPSGTEHVAVDILRGGAVLFGSSTQLVGTEWQSFPKGMGYRLREDYEIVARMHYVNASAEPLTVSPVYRWYTIAEEALTQEIGPFAWTYSEFRIPPRAELTVRADCYLDRPMHIVSMLPHMHALGRRISAGYLGGPRDGLFFFDNQGYGDLGESDILEYHPAIDLSQGDGVSFQCTWRNTFDKTIVEGVGDNEMCILFGYAYPPKNAYSALALAQDNCVPVTPP